jgi:SLT domain-containing protein
LAKGGKVTKPSWHFLGEGGESEYVVPESKLGSFISKILVNTSSATQKLVMPVGAMGGINNSRSTNYNIKANYTRSQDPQSLRLDLEAIAMMARS